MAQHLSSLHYTHTRPDQLTSPTSSQGTSGTCPPDSQASGIADHVILVLQHARDFAQYLPHRAWAD